MKKVHILGSGFSSLSAAAYLAKGGYEVTIYEKNASPGGRARQLKNAGFTFDMGPTWYWMPDVFERFFADFGKLPSDYYELVKLNPAYQVYFGEGDSAQIGDSLDKIIGTFEEIEKGSSVRLLKFMKIARDNYEIAIKDLVYRPGVSPLELITPKTVQKLGQFASTISNEVRKLFTHSKLIRILEFPVLFLGAKPSQTPAFYSFMNQADFGLGTYHPTNGMYSVVEGMVELAESLGVRFEYNAEVTAIHVRSGQVDSMTVNDRQIKADIVLSGADYHHTETLLQTQHRAYSEAYWDKKIFAPSSLLFYVGFDKKIENVCHHTLFFDVDFDAHAESIYDRPSWPEEPLFYASFPSKTDGSFAPEGQEAAVFLIPLAPGIADTEKLRDLYFKKIINRFETVTRQKIENHIVFKSTFCINDFISDYNSYKGNAYGMANTLLQTAFLRPKLKSKKVKNLYFTGQLTVPGPGVPPSLISGKLVSGLIQKYHPLTNVTN